MSSVQNPCWLIMIGDYTAQYILDYSNPIEESLFSNQCIGMREGYRILLRFVQVSALVYIIIIIQPHRWNTSEPRPKCLLIGKPLWLDRFVATVASVSSGNLQQLVWAEVLFISDPAWHEVCPFSSGWLLRAVIELTQTMCFQSIPKVGALVSVRSFTGDPFPKPIALRWIPPCRGRWFTGTWNPGTFWWIATATWRSSGSTLDA